jgi:hypothetical protein
VAVVAEAVQEHDRCVRIGGGFDFDSGQEC